MPAPRRKTAASSSEHPPRPAAPVPQPQNWLSPVWALVALAVALIPLAAWLNRGFDLTDEGSYLLGYQHPRDVFLTLTHFQPLVAALTGNQAWPVPFYRVAGLSLSVVSAAFFAIQVCRFTAPADRPQRPSRWVALAAFTALGSLLGYSTGPRSLSYNGLNGALTLVEAALGLMLLRRDAVAPAASRRFGVAILLGLALGAQFVVKATSTATMCAWLLGGALLLDRDGRGRWPAEAAGVALGVAMFAAAFFGGVVPYATWWTGISMHRAVSQSHSLLALLGSSIAPVAGQLGVAGLPVAIAVALVVAGARFDARGRRSIAAVLRRTGAALVVVAALVVGVTPGGINRVVHGSTPFGMLMALALTMWLVMRPRRGGHAAAHAAVTPRARLFLLLLVLPAAGALGTNNPLTVAVSLGLAPWFAILWLVAEDSSASPSRVWTHVVVAAAALIAVAEVNANQIVTPYRIPGGLGVQEIAFSPRIPAGKGLRVDADTKQFVESARELLDRSGFQPGDPVLAFYDLPGLVYLVGGRSPILPWFFANSDSLTCRALDLAQAELGRGRVFLFVRNGLTPEVAQCLRAAGVGDDITTLGTIHSRHYGDLYVLARIPPAVSP